MTLLLSEANESSESTNSTTLEFEGEYGTDDVFSLGGGSIIDESGVISLYGNVWKSFKLQTPYRATGNTHIFFKFELVNEAEGHAICAEDDLNADTFGGFHKRCIALAGSQYDDWHENHVRKIDRAKESEVLTQKVLIGDLFPEVGTNIMYISFVQDNDAAPFEGVSSFWDIRLFEVAPVSL